MTHAQVKVATKARKVAYQQQRELRAELSSAIKGVATRCSGKLLWHAWKSAEEDRIAFRAWLQGQVKSMPESMHRVRGVCMYLLRSNTALGGMNQYMEYVAQNMAEAALNAGLLPKSNAIAASLAASLNELLQLNKGKP